MNPSSDRIMLAAMLDMQQASVVVVGGGAVGQRKAKLAAAERADVTVVALEVPPDGWTTKWLTQPYHESCLHGAAIVFAAATAEVNSRVVADAKRLGIWVNSASNPREGTITIPAVVTRGALQIAVSTHGASPAFARRIREKLDAQFDDAYREFLVILAEVREHILREVADPSQRRHWLESFSDWSWLSHLRTEGPSATRTAMLQQLSTQPK